MNDHEVSHKSTHSANYSLRNNPHVLKCNLTNAPPQMSDIPLSMGHLGPHQHCPRPASQVSHPLLAEASTLLMVSPESERQILVLPTGLEAHSAFAHPCFLQGLCLKQSCDSSLDKVLGSWKEGKQLTQPRDQKEFC